MSGRRDISAERLFEDQLVLVTGGNPKNWKEDFVRIDWGRSLGLEIASRLGIAPETGLVLDLGQRSARWLIVNQKSGYMPEYLVTLLLEAGDLTIIEDAPSFDFPAYVSWRDDLDAELAAEVVLTFHKIHRVPICPEISSTYASIVGKYHFSCSKEGNQLRTDDSLLSNAT